MVHMGHFRVGERQPEKKPGQKRGAHDKSTAKAKASDKGTVSKKKGGEAQAQATIERARCATQPHSWITFRCWLRACCHLCELQDELNLAGTLHVSGALPVRATKLPFTVT